MQHAADFETIDRHIEDLQAKIENCRQAMILSRAAIFGAAALLALVLIVVTSYRTPTVVFSAVATMIGGVVWLGASKSSLQDAHDELATLDATKNRMIDQVAADNGWRDITPTVH